MPRLPRITLLLALLCAGAFGVHQGRYFIAHGASASERLDAEGHAYLELLGPVVAVALAAVAAVLLRRLLVGAPARGRTGVLRFGAAVGTTLAAIYVGQELVEGLLASGHADGWSGVFGDGGWMALPLSALAGLGIATIVRVGEEGPVLASQAACRPPVHDAPPIALVALGAALEGAFARAGLSARGPPVWSP